MSNPGESYTDANTDPADRPRPPEQPQPAPPEPRTVWDVVKAFLARLAEAEPAVTVEQATAELVAALDAHRVLRTERDRYRIATAEQAAWVLGRVPDHGEEANLAARAAYAQWRRLVPETQYAELGAAMTEGGYARLVAAAAEGRQRMWDTVTRAVPGAHQAQLGPPDEPRPPVADLSWVQLEGVRGGDSPPEAGEPL